jgi:hypothetical protein
LDSSVSVGLISIELTELVVGVFVLLVTESTACTTVDVVAVVVVVVVVVVDCFSVRCFLDFGVPVIFGGSLPSASSLFSS